MADRGRGGPSRPFTRGGPGGGRRGGGPSQSNFSSGGHDARPRREAILDLSKYANQRIRVKFTGGREVTGLLKGYDQLLNLVLDEVEEEVQLPTPSIRSLGLVVLRGPTITLVSPVDGSEEIANPFAQEEA